MALDKTFRLDSELGLYAQLQKCVDVVKVDSSHDTLEVWPYISMQSIQLVSQRKRWLDFFQNGEKASDEVAYRFFSPLCARSCLLQYSLLESAVGTVPFACRRTEFTPGGPIRLIILIPRSSDSGE